MYVGKVFRVAAWLPRGASRLRSKGAFAPRRCAASRRDPVGQFGAADRLDFTAIGPAVNLVSRLEGLCRPLGKAVLVSGAFAAQTTTPLIPLGTHELRGIAAPCAVYTLPEN